MNVFMTAELKTYEEFLKVYQPGDECREDDGKTLIFYATANTNQEERYKMVKFLLSKGARTDLVSPSGFNLLNILLARVPVDKKDLPKIIELSKAFIEGGASVNHINKNGETPLNDLMNFWKYSDEELAPLYDLFEAQGDLLVTYENNWGYSAIDLAKKLSNRQSLVKRLEKYVNSPLNTVQKPKPKKKRTYKKKG